MARRAPPGRGRFVRAPGPGRLILQAEGTAWSVIEAPHRGPASVLAAGLDLGYAQGLAEDRVRQMGASVLIDPHARWRIAPASAKQLAARRRRRVPVRRGLTRGEASDLLTAVF